MRIRAFLTVIIALLTGFTIGYITSNQVRHFKTRDVRSMSSVQTFKERSIELIIPTEKQMEDIGPIIDKYAIQFDSLRKSASQSYKNFIEEYHSQIFPYLEKDQIERVNEFGKRWRRGKKHEYKDEKSD